jgi:membrane protein YqaA with SNARE-associated domain
MLRELYDWVLSWADSPYGVPALAMLSFAESSFFPIPPDVLLIALAVGAPAKAFYFALVCSIASVLGGLLGYLIGWGLWEAVGKPIFRFYGYMDKFEWVQEKFRRYDAWAVALAGFTPIPYKVFTIASGACRISFPVFVIASALSRSARFFLVAGLIFWKGQAIKDFIEKYFNLLSILFFVLLFAGFYAIKWLTGKKKEEKQEEVEASTAEENK